MRVVVTGVKVQFRRHTAAIISAPRPGERHVVVLYSILCAWKLNVFILQQNVYRYKCLWEAHCDKTGQATMKTGLGTWGSKTAWHWGRPSVICRGNCDVRIIQTPLMHPPFHIYCLVYNILFSDFVFLMDVIPPFPLRYTTRWRGDLGTCGTRRGTHWVSCIKASSSLLRITSVDSRYVNARFQRSAKSIYGAAEGEPEPRSITVDEEGEGEDPASVAWPRTLSEYGASWASYDDRFQHRACCLSSFVRTNLVRFGRQHGCNQVIRRLRIREFREGQQARRESLDIFRRKSVQKRVS